MKFILYSKQSVSSIRNETFEQENMYIKGFTRSKGNMAPKYLSIHFFLITKSKIIDKK